MKDEKNSFLKNNVITLIRQFLSIVIGVLFISVLARFLGTEDRGYYAIITLFPLMLITFLNLGINTSTIFFVSKKEFDLPVAIVTNVIMAVVLSVVSFVIGFIFIEIFKDTMFAHVPTYCLYTVLLALPFMFLASFLQTVFQGLQNFKVFNSILLVQQVGTLLLVSTLIVINDLGLFGAILAFVFGYVVTVIYISYILYRHYKVRLRVEDFSVVLLKNSLSYGIKAHVSNSITVLNYRTAILMLTSFSVPSVVAIYDVAVSIGERLSIFSQSISSVLFPKISSMQGEENRNKLTATVSRSLIIFMICISVVLFFLSDWIFHILFAKYPESSLIFKILLPGLALLSVEKLLSNDLAGRGKPELNTYVSISNLCVNVVLCFILIPKYGAVGAAISCSIMYITSFIVKVILYKKYTDQQYRSFLILNHEDIVSYKKIIKKLFQRFSS